MNMGLGVGAWTLLLLSCGGTSIDAGGSDLGGGPPRGVVPEGRVPDALPPEANLAPIPRGAELLAHLDGGDRLLPAPIPLRLHQVAELLQEMEPRRFDELKTLLVLDARIRTFARKYGVFVPESDLSLAFKRAWAGIQRRFARSGMENLEAFCHSAFGLSPQALREKLRLREARRLLRSYALRYRLRRAGSLTLDFVWSRDKASLERFHRKLASGASFEPLLRRLFREDPSARGGHLPPMPLDGDHSALQLAKDWKGEGPMPPRPMPGPGGTPGFAWLEVREKVAPDPRPFEQVWPELQKDLARHPVGAGELELFLSDRYDDRRDG